MVYSDVTVFFEVVDSVHDFRNQDLFFSFKYTGCCPKIYRKSPGLVFFWTLVTQKLTSNVLKDKKKQLVKPLVWMVLGYFTRFRVLKLTNIGGKSLIQ